MAENAWGKQPPKKSAYTPPPLSTPSFWGPAPVPPKVITEWEEIWGEDGGDGTAYEGQDSLEVNAEGNFRADAREQGAGAHDSWVGGEEKRFESEYGVEGTTADGRFQAEALDKEDVPEYSVEGTTVDGRFRAEFEGQNPNTEGNFRAGAREQEAGAHDSWVGGEEKRFESEFGVEGTTQDGSSRAEALEKEGVPEFGVEGEEREGGKQAQPLEKKDVPEYGVEGITADGRSRAAFEGQNPNTEGSSRALFEGQNPNTEGSFRAVFEGEDPNTAGSFRAAFTGLDPNTAGNFRRLIKGEQPNTAGKFRASALGKSSAAEEKEHQESQANYTNRYKAQGRSSKPTDFSVSPYERSGNFQAKPVAQNKASSYEVVPFKPLAAPSGRFNPSPVPTKTGKADASPYVGQWNFRVEINGIPLKNSQFVSVSGVVSETEAINYKFSGDAYMQAMPGVYKFSDVELARVHKKGSDEFYKWREAIESGKDDMRVVTIHLMNVNMNDGPVMTMVLHDAWPMKWEFPELNAGSSDVALEKITLNVGRITKA